MSASPDTPVFALGQSLAAPARCAVPFWRKPRTFWFCGIFLAGTLPGAELKKDIVYGEAAGEPLLLDASIPEGSGLHPVALLVHGGGWSSGDKAGSEKPGSGNDITPWFAPLTAAKFTWFSINYRLAPTHLWPAGFDDLLTAIRWVKQHAAEYGGDPRRIVLFGHSSGGHLVCLAGTRTTEDTQVQAIVGFAAVTDLVADTANRGALSPSLQGLFNLPKKPTPASLAVLRNASPLAQVRAGLPPFLLVHGDADKTVPLAMSLAFQAKLHEAGVTCDLIAIHGAPHRLVGWERFDPTYADKVVAWLNKTLAPPEPRTVK